MRYSRQELIGEGGMATVYRALDLETGESVAMKIPRPECLADPESRERFRREGEAATRLCHPNIVRALAQVETEEGPALVLELVEGETLRDLLDREAPLPVAAAVRLLRQILVGLEYAHAHGVVHRDVSPRNVLLDASGHVRLTDFGIARTGVERTLTRTREVLGSVGYFSPEQAMGEPVGPQADLYSVGVLGYEMLTGELPFSGENAVQIALKHVHEQPPALEERRPDVPAPLRDALARALRKEPSGRFASAADMLAALEPADLDATLTRPPGWLPPAIAATRPLPAPAGALARASGQTGGAWERARRAAAGAWGAALAVGALSRWAAQRGRRWWGRASPRVRVWMQDALGPPSVRPQRARMLLFTVGAILLAALLAGAVASRSFEPRPTSVPAAQEEADSLQRHLERKREALEREQELQREALRRERDAGGARAEEQVPVDEARAHEEQPQRDEELARLERKRQQKRVNELAREEQKRGKRSGHGGGKGRKGRR